MRRHDAGAFQDLLAAIAEDVTCLAGKQLELFRAETGEAVQRVISAVVMAALGLTAAISTLIFLGIALFEWLVVVLSSRPIAALSVAGVAALVALCLLSLAYGRLMRTTFVPRRTLASLRRTATNPFDEADDG